MPYASVADVRENAIFKAMMADLPDPQIEYWIKRAERQVIREIGRSFEAETDVDILFDLNVATVYQVDVIYLNSNPELAHLKINGIKSEKKGEYTVQFGSAEEAMRQFESTATEYNSIVTSLKTAPTSNTITSIFRVGKNRKRVDYREPD